MAPRESPFSICVIFSIVETGHNDNIRGQQWSTFGDYSYVMGRGKRPRREIYESEMLILSAYSIQIALSLVCCNAIWVLLNFQMRKSQKVEIESEIPASSWVTGVCKI
jgi:hypothetical protein